MYPHDFAQFIIDNYFRFLDDVFYEWLKEFNIAPFQLSCNRMDPNLVFIFEELSKEQNYLDVNVKVVGYELLLDIYRKPTDSFNYLHYRSCHPSHTINNIALSLAKRIIRITSEDPGPRLLELKNNLILRGHPEENIDEAFTKVFSPQTIDKTGDIIVFTYTHNPAQIFGRKRITGIFDNLCSDSMKKTFKDCRVILGTRQPKPLRQSLIRSKFTRSKPICHKKNPGLYNCRRNCKYHRTGYVRYCKGFSFGKDRQFKWEYTRLFSCDSKNVIYILICKSCWRFYIGETSDLKPRIRKHVSDIKHPKNSYCRVLAEHLRKCSPLTPQFNIFPFLYVDNQARRRFIEKRLILRFQPPLNADG